MTPSRCIASLAICVSLISICGCGGKSTPTTIRGLALYRGEPLAGGMVVFAPNPDRGSSGPVVTGTIQADGTFILETADGKSLQPGWYRVAISPAPGTVDVATAERPYPGLPAKYRVPSLSGLEREVRSNVENRFEFDLDDA